jgi:hypothetical protein
MSQPEIQSDKTFTIVRGPFDQKKRQLIIGSTGIKFEDGKTRGGKFTVLPKSTIAEFKYGIDWISGLEFTIGREYLILIKTNDNKEIKIGIKSLYGWNRNKNYNLFEGILDSIWNNYFQDITTGFIDKFYANQPFTLAQVGFDQKKLTIKKAGIITEKETIINWDNVKVTDYQTYYVIHSKEDSAFINRSYNYLDDWNVTVLRKVLSLLLKDVHKIE